MDDVPRGPILPAAAAAADLETQLDAMLSEMFAAHNEPEISPPLLAEQKADHQPPVFTFPRHLSADFSDLPVFAGSRCSVALLAIWLLQLVRTHHTTDLLGQDVLAFLKYVMCPVENKIPKSYKTIREHVQKVGTTLITHRFDFLVFLRVFFMFFV
jgi:hypothetical protein